MSFKLPYTFANTKALIDANESTPVPYETVDNDSFMNLHWVLDKNAIHDPPLLAVSLKVIDASEIQLVLSNPPNILKVHDARDADPQATIQA